MTRFFMSIPEAVQLVLQSAALSTGGEVFMLEMGEPVKIMDLAQRMIALSGRRVGTDVEIRVTGMRPGEKLAEELCTPEERRAADRPPVDRPARPADACPRRARARAAASWSMRRTTAGTVSYGRACSPWRPCARGAGRRTRRSRRPARRVIDLRGDDRDEDRWTRSTT